MTTATIFIDRVPREDKQTRASSPLFRESEVAPAWMRWMGGVFFIGGAALVAAIFCWPADAPELALFVPAAVSVVLGFLLLTARTGLTIDDESVRLQFRPLPTRAIPRQRIVAAKVIEPDVREQGGLGLRFRSHRRSLMLTPGIGVEITDDLGRRTFVRVDRPAEAVRALELSA